MYFSFCNYSHLFHFQQLEHKTDNRNHTGHIVDENEEIAVARRD